MHAARALNAQRKRRDDRLHPQDRSRRPSAASSVYSITNGRSPSHSADLEAARVRHQQKKQASPGVDFAYVGFIIAIFGAVPLLVGTFISVPALWEVGLGLTIIGLTIGIVFWCCNFCMRKTTTYQKDQQTNGDANAGGRRSRPHGGKVEDIASIHKGTTSPYKTNRPSSATSTTSRSKSPTHQRGQVPDVRVETISERNKPISLVSTNINGKSNPAAQVPPVDSSILLKSSVAATATVTAAAAAAAAASYKSSKFPVTDSYANGLTPVDSNVNVESNVQAESSHDSETIGNPPLNDNTPDPDKDSDDLSESNKLDDEEVPQDPDLEEQLDADDPDNVDDLLKYTPEINEKSETVVESEATLTGDSEDAMLTVEEAIAEIESATEDNSNEQQEDDNDKSPLQQVGEQSLDEMTEDAGDGNAEGDDDNIAETNAIEEDTEGPTGDVKLSPEDKIEDPELPVDNPEGDEELGNSSSDSSDDPKADGRSTTVSNTDGDADDGDLTLVPLPTSCANCNASTTTLIQRSTQETQTEETPTCSKCQKKV